MNISLLLASLLSAAPAHALRAAPLSPAMASAPRAVAPVSALPASVSAAAPAALSAAPPAASLASVPAAMRPEAAMSAAAAVPAEAAAAASVEESGSAGRAAFDGASERRGSAAPVKAASKPKKAKRPEPVIMRSRDVARESVIVSYIDDKDYRKISAAIESATGLTPSYASPFRGGYPGLYVDAADDRQAAFFATAIRKELARKGVYTTIMVSWDASIHLGYPREKLVTSESIKKLAAAFTDEQLHAAQGKAIGLLRLYDHSSSYDSKGVVVRFRNKREHDAARSSGLTPPQIGGVPIRYENSYRRRR